MTTTGRRAGAVDGQVLNVASPESCRRSAIRPRRAGGAVPGSSADRNPADAVATVLPSVLTRRRIGEEGDRGRARRPRSEDQRVESPLENAEPARGAAERAGCRAQREPGGGLTVGNRRSRRRDVSRRVPSARGGPPAHGRGGVFGGRRHCRRSVIRSDSGVIFRQPSRCRLADERDSARGARGDGGLLADAAPTRCLVAVSVYVPPACRPRGPDDATPSTTGPNGSRAMRARRSGYRGERDGDDRADIAGLGADRIAHGDLDWIGDIWRPR